MKNKVHKNVAANIYVEKNDLKKNLNEVIIK